MGSVARLAASLMITVARSTSSGNGYRRKNKVLSDLIRSDHLREARKVFDSLPHRNVVTWNSMISGYIRHREISLARKLFDEMPSRDVVSWNCMLSGYALSHDPDELVEARRLFDRMPERDSISWNTMISGYVRNGKMVEAMQMFGVMPKRNVVSWNTVITGFLHIGEIKNAVELFEIMPARDAASLNAIVCGFIQNNMLEEAAEMLRSSEALEIDGAVDAYNTLIAGYGRAGRVKEAREVFDSIPCQKRREKCFQRNVVSWNSMIMCYVKASDLLSARRLFDEMPERDMVSWNTMIAAYSQALEMDEAKSLFQQVSLPDVRSWNSLICGFTQKGEVDKARKLFDQLPQKELVTWNTMIAGYERNGDLEEAIKLFCEMLASGERADRHTMSSLLSACAGLASIRQGTQIHQLIMKTLVPDIAVNNSLINMYSRCGSLNEAKCIFVLMRTRRDVISWNSMIRGFALHGLAEEALDLFKEMKLANVRPTQITFVAVLHACGHAGLVEDGKKEFDSMIKEFNLVPNVEHYAALVDLICRFGQLDEAMEVIKGMVNPPDQAVWGSVLGACRVHKNADLARVAAEALAAIEPNSSSPYVLRYNIHADEGRWEDALQVREVMDKKGVFKQPGYSWIELQNGVHIFIAGDSSHPLSQDIYSMVESCNRLINE